MCERVKAGESGHWFRFAGDTDVLSEANVPLSINRGRLELTVA